MQHVSQNELKQITEIRILSQNKQIAKMRQIKNYKKIPKEKLLIALLKLEQSLLNFIKVNLIMQK